MTERKDFDCIRETDESASRASIDQRLLAIEEHLSYLTDMIEMALKLNYLSPKPIEKGPTVINGEAFQIRSKKT